MNPRKSQQLPLGAQVGTQVSCRCSLRQPPTRWWSSRTQWVQRSLRKGQQRARCNESSSYCISKLQWKLYISQGTNNHEEKRATVVRFLFNLLLIRAYLSTSLNWWLFASSQLLQFASSLPLVVRTVWFHCTTRLKRATGTVLHPIGVAPTHFPWRTGHYSSSTTWTPQLGSSLLRTR